MSIDRNRLSVERRSYRDAIMENDDYRPTSRLLSGPVIVGLKMLRDVGWPVTTARCPSEREAAGAWGSSSFHHRTTTSDAQLSATATTLPRSSTQVVHSTEIERRLTATQPPRW